MRDSIFVFLICFWTLLAVLSNAFDQELSETDINEIRPDSTEVSLITQDNSIFNWLDQIPGINLLTPLLKIMFFEYTDQIPPAVSLLLDMTAIFTVYIIFGMIRGN